MQRHLQPAVDRFKALTDETQRSAFREKLIEDFMIQRMADNDKIVTRYMDDQEFQNASFPILAKEIFDAVHAAEQRKPES